jgi:hypothetical protein
MIDDSQLRRITEVSKVKPLASVGDLLDNANGILAAINSLNFSDKGSQPLNNVMMNNTSIMNTTSNTSINQGKASPISSYSAKKRDDGGRFSSVSAQNLKGYNNENVHHGAGSSSRAGSKTHDKKSHALHKDSSRGFLDQNLKNILAHKDEN